MTSKLFFHIEGRGEKKNKIKKNTEPFFTAGWTNIKKTKKNNLSPSTSVLVCGEHAFIGWFSKKRLKKKKKHIEISGYMAAGAEVGHRGKKKG